MFHSENHPEEILDFDLESLQRGDTKRICHEECVGYHNDLTLSVTRVYKGLLYNCYRCHVSGIFLVGSTPKDAKNYMRDVKRDTNSVDYFNVPRDCIPMAFYKGKKIPKKAYNYLSNYGVEEDELYKFNILYSPRYNMVVYPLYDTDDSLMGWVGRNINYEKRPK